MGCGNDVMDLDLYNHEISTKYSNSGFPDDPRVDHQNDRGSPVSLLTLPHFPMGPSAEK